MWAGTASAQTPVESDHMLYLEFPQLESNTYDVLTKKFAGNTTYALGEVCQKAKVVSFKILNAGNKTEAQHFEAVRAILATTNINIPDFLPTYNDEAFLNRCKSSRLRP
jgi:hypothetical protein